MVYKPVWKDFLQLITSRILMQRWFWSLQNLRFGILGVHDVQWACFWDILSLRRWNWQFWLAWNSYFRFFYFLIISELASLKYMIAPKRHRFEMAIWCNQLVIPFTSALINIGHWLDQMVQFFEIHFKSSENRLALWYFEIIIFTSILISIV